MALTYLYRTTGTATSTQKFTVSAWVKQCLNPTGATDQTIWGNGSSTTNLTYLRLRSANNSLQFYLEAGGTEISNYVTNRLFRDVSAWYHIVLAVDTTQTTAANRVKIYVNGVQETSFSSSVVPSVNHSVAYSSNNLVNIGRRPHANDSYFDGYMNNVVFVDGTQLTPTSFGETDSTSGIWKWKKITGVTWGTNGFHLKMDNDANLGLDSSGNTNNLTPSGNGIQAKDTPINSRATLNPLNRRLTTNNPTYSNSNTSLQGQTVNGQNNNAIATFGDLKSGKWYFEVKVGTAGDSWGIGIADNPQGANGNGTGGNYHVYYQLDGYKNVGAAGGSSYGATFTTGNIIGCAFDLDNGTIIFYKDGATQGTADTGLITNMVDGYTPIGFTNKGLMHWNFGNGYFGTTKITSAGSNGNGSLFEYDVPSGYYALNTKNINTYG